MRERWSNIARTFRRATGTDSPGGLVLCADGDPLVLRVEQILLRELGFDVVTAETSAEVLTFASARREDLRLLVLDAGMPGSDGLGILGAVRAVGSDAPVILTTTRCEPALAEAKARGERPQAFLRKPYTVAQLQAAIDAALPTD